MKERFQAQLGRTQSELDLPIKPQIASVDEVSDAERFGSYRYEDGHRFRVSTAQPATPEETAAHEYAHAIDVEASIAITGRPEYLSTTNHPILDGWRAAIEATPEVRDLRGRSKMLRDAGFDADADRIDYLLLPAELWARSVSQWVAARLQGPAAAQLAAKQASEESSQWSSTSFQQIDEAISQVFEELRAS